MKLTKFSFISQCDGLCIHGMCMVPDREVVGVIQLVHGMADDNVHFQNCAEYAEHLVQLGKQFDMQVYTNRNHGIYGGNTRQHLYTRLTNFFLNNL